MLRQIGVARISSVLRKRVKESGKYFTDEKDSGV